MVKSVTLLNSKNKVICSCFEMCFLMLNYERFTWIVHEVFIAHEPCFLLKWCGWKVILS
jgi:hypothetical protein